jgi:hypothetical protein
MSDESNVLAPSRIARWTAIALVIAFTVALYFRTGRNLPPLTGAPVTGEPGSGAAPGQPAN